MSRLSRLVLPAVMVCHVDVFAQERGVEVHGGLGYVIDAGQGPSVPAVNAGAVVWMTPRWGAGVRLMEGIGNDDFDEPIGTTLGVGGLRMWTVTSQWRWFARGTEVNVALGGGSHAYRFHHAGTSQPTGDRSGSGFVAIDLLVGRRLHGSLHVKGGFTYGLGWDLHPFQPVLLFAWTP
jgi:hypothetical protein